jgi:hypothetical protein
MVAPFMSLTGFAAIKATLGLTNAAELPDAYITSSGVAEELEADLLAWVPYSIPELVAIGAGDNPTPKARQQYLWLSAYARYFCAASLAVSFAILIQKSITDGQNELVRQDQKLSDFLAALRASRDAYKNRFLDVSGQTTQAAAGIMSSIQPSFDPVTNETT